VLGDRYQIKTQLGRGGMGEVWHAFDLKLRVEVALKAMLPNLFKDERRRDLLRSEVRAAREVVSPNVCRIFDLIEVDGSELVSMEYMDGGTLLDVLQERGPLELKEAQDIASQFLAGLEAIHQAGLIHRDVKPENIMITRAGRVVLMDFGLARQEDSGAGTVSGTPAYMAPEQVAGLKVDARADVYSAGVVLAEMVSPDGIRDFESRQSVWEGIRQAPARVPDSPWAPVLKKAVAKEPDQRYDSAHTLTRALEEVTLRVEGAEDLTPYPGLASFSEEDAEYFFGREAEVEAIWKKLKRPRLLALVGPSGTGKSSFIRAGLLPTLPHGWSSIVSTPGHRPLQALGQALVPSFSGDTEAMQKFLQFEEAQTAVDLVSRWRQAHEHALIVVDQFEELFTLNPPEVQASFAELLGRLVLEADVHVLVSLRDDFLFQCHGHEALAPILSELTLLGPLSESGLRRALVQPALACGYRFEDETLVEEMIEEVGQERGALPLLAFASSRLWEKRDREQGLLTREAYQEIGGVAGALAQHAEATLEQIGTHRAPVVRELFRNLVTGQGTRAVRERGELLSVFEKPEAPQAHAEAEEALAALIDARLLTSFEQSGEESGESRQEIEFIHESLLGRWPRLVRWQTQDADGAQLRDQLRQAARVWEEKGRPEDLIWSGASFLEYRAWRGRYSGGLTETEEAFTRAATALAQRKRRLRRFAVAAVISVLSVGLATVGFFWRSALAETRRAEASKLLALGRLQLEEYPTGALAYAMASLERHDEPTVRRFVMEALWRGPTEIQVAKDLDWGRAFFTSDGEWILRRFGPFELRPRDGGSPRALPSAGIFYPLPEGRLLSWNPEDRSLGVWTLPGVERTDTQTLDEGEQIVDWAEGRLYTTLSVEKRDGRSLVELRSRVLDGSPAKTHGRFWSSGNVGVDPRGRWLVFRDGKDVYALPAQDLASGDLRRLGPIDDSRAIFGPTFSSDGNFAGMREDSTGKVHMWPLTDHPAPPLVFQPREGGAGWGWLSINGDGSKVASVGQPLVRIWNQAGPHDADPVILRLGEISQVNNVSFHPAGTWVVTHTEGRLSVWPLARTYPRVLRGHTGHVVDVAFTPDGRHLVTASGDGTLRLWPLVARSGERARVLHRQRDSLVQLDIEPGGRSIVTTSSSGRVSITPLAGGPRRELEGFRRSSWDIAVGPQSRRVAASGAWSTEERNLIRVWDLESGEVRAVDRGRCGWPRPLDFTRDGRLVYVGHSVLNGTDHSDGLQVWDPESGDSRLLLDGVANFALGPENELAYAFDWPDPIGEKEKLLTVEAVSRVDLRTGSVTKLPLPFVYEGVRAAAVDRTVLVTGHTDGSIRVTPLDGGPPHLLLGHGAQVRGVAISPDGRWIASSSDDATLRLWPMPEGTPFHTLPPDELLERLRALTNVRAVEDEESSTGYTLDLAPFPGWEKVPAW
jgi:serine/threonine protein kinase/WD40 repeat protein